MVAGRSTQPLDSMPNSVAKFLWGAPSFWHTTSRAAGALGIFAAILWAIEGSLGNFIFWAVWAIVFLTIGTTLSVRNIRFLYLGIFGIGLAVAIWRVVKHAV